ncbi:alkane 1-monooxygenase [Paracoccus pacificus]|uniref:Alkane 1-monooxygenase n=1 Tax=Paracoccus pacificus TaxID=1463598 RepID=A0ABW4RBE3_9RHOB
MAAFPRWSGPPEIWAFALAALAPAVLILLAAAFGGWWVWLALVWISLASPSADTIIARAFPDPEEGRATPGANALSVTLVGAHFIVLAATLSALTDAWMGGWAGPGMGQVLGPWHKLGLFLAAGMFFGQVSNSNAHELIHRSTRGLFALGAAVFVSLLFGHHTSSHRLVHHLHVATDRDPNSARLGEGFWRFFPRAWFGSFRDGLAAERALSARRAATGGATGAAGQGRLNPYVIWVGGAVACMVGVALIWGGSGLAFYLALSLYAQMQLMMSDYVQHYGLRRRQRADGRIEPVGPAHSWDAGHPLSSLMMVNAPRHSDHHAHPGRAYPDLRLARGTPPRPVLPYSLPLMAAIALVPPLWRRIMDRRVERMRRFADVLAEAPV